jgi:hypothetical protein
LEDEVQTEEPIVVLPARGNEPPIVIPKQTNDQGNATDYQQMGLLLLGTAMFVIVLVIGFILIQAKAERVDTRNALCQLRLNLETRVAGSRKFLRDNPKGIPGIPPALIRQSIAEQNQTIKALSNLNC